MTIALPFLIFVFMIKSGEFYEMLYRVALLKKEERYLGYKTLRELLCQICYSEMEGLNLQMTDLSARISYIASKLKLSIVDQNKMHSLRLNTNAVLNNHQDAAVDETKFFNDIKTLTFLVRKLTRDDIPTPLRQLLPKKELTFIPDSRTYIDEKRRMRVCFQYKDTDYLYVTSLDKVENNLLKVRYNIEHVNREFTESSALFWTHAQLNLLDVKIDSNGILTPSLIILEPDYLLDVSALAECFKEYGHDALNYIVANLQPRKVAEPLLLGNIVNLFLDEWINADGKLNYSEVMKKFFRHNALSLAACPELNSDAKTESCFFEKTKKHFLNVKEIVYETFLQLGYELDKEDAVLEPSYICEALGIQGRLDYMQRDMSAFIEMKSGKADEYSVPSKVRPKENHLTQMLLYRAILKYSMSVNDKNYKLYLLYTRYPLLYPAFSSWSFIRRIMNVRNCIVAREYDIQHHNSIEYTARLFASITPERVNVNNISGVLWQRYLAPIIQNLNDKITALSPVEAHYFFRLYNFVTKELYLSKSGDIDGSGRLGSSSLWLSSLLEKSESGEILYDLLIEENNMDDDTKPYVRFQKNLHNVSGLPNFRTGDAVLFYQRNDEQDNVTNKMIFKGNVEAITETSVTVRLRATQKNRKVLPQESCYALEHDFMDSTFKLMFANLGLFITASPQRRALLLGQRPPAFDKALLHDIENEDDDFKRVIRKAEAARDYFLLVGPPGTGKTSFALRGMVERFYEQQKTILLLSYTNRAVDEMCKMLTKIPSVDFIRIGSELSCAKEYREHLAENIFMNCSNRQEVRQLFHRYRIVIGTVATISNKPELFLLKHFDVAIIDEATQILEPQLLGLLSATDSYSRQVIDKFIMIGDYKQLPAIVLQSDKEAQVTDRLLHESGIYSLKDSLFERLYRFEKKRFRSSESSTTNERLALSYDMLTKQGRMHPDIALFANHQFYQSQLSSVGLHHQVEQVGYPRLEFYPSQREEQIYALKINRSEQQIIVQLVEQIYHELGGEFNPKTTLGIIAPYRSQIALIRNGLDELKIPALSEVLIDTVERFQGSECDIIIYSFCLNRSVQLNFLCNTIEEDGQLIDRKLNVALTRARKRLILTGVPSILRENKIYSLLLDYVINYKKIYNLNQLKV